MTVRPLLTLLAAAILLASCSTPATSTQPAATPTVPHTETSPTPSLTPPPIAKLPTARGSLVAASILMAAEAFVTTDKAVAALVVDSGVPHVVGISGDAPEVAWDVNLGAGAQSGVLFATEEGFVAGYSATTPRGERWLAITISDEGAVRGAANVPGEVLGATDGMIVVLGSKQAAALPVPMSGTIAAPIGAEPAWTRPAVDGQVGAGIALLASRSAATAVVATNGRELWRQPLIAGDAMRIEAASETSVLLSTRLTGRATANVRGLRVVRAATRQPMGKPLPEGPTYVRTDRKSGFAVLTYDNGTSLRLNMADGSSAALVVPAEGIVLAVGAGRAWVTNPGSAMPNILDLRTGGLLGPANGFPAAVTANATLYFDPARLQPVD